MLPIWDKQGGIVKKGGGVLNNTPDASTSAAWCGLPDLDRVSGTRELGWVGIWRTIAIAASFFDIILYSLVCFINRNP